MFYEKYLYDYYKKNPPTVFNYNSDTTLNYREMKPNFVAQEIWDDFCDGKYVIRRHAEVLFIFGTREEQEYAKLREPYGGNLESIINHYGYADIYISIIRKVLRYLDNEFDATDYFNMIFSLERSEGTAELERKIRCVEFAAIVYNLATGHIYQGWEFPDRPTEMLIDEYNAIENECNRKLDIYRNVAEPHIKKLESYLYDIRLYGLESDNLEFLKLRAKDVSLQIQDIKNTLVEVDGKFISLRELHSKIFSLRYSVEKLCIQESIVLYDKFISENNIKEKFDDMLISYFNEVGRISDITVATVVFQNGSIVELSKEYDEITDFSDKGLANRAYKELIELGKEEYWQVTHNANYIEIENKKYHLSLLQNDISYRGIYNVYLCDEKFELVHEEELGLFYRAKDINDGHVKMIIKDGQIHKCEMIEGRNVIQKDIK